MRRLRKYLVFWIVILAASIPFAAPLGTWVRSVLTLKPVNTAANFSNSSGSSEPLDNVAGGPDEQLALNLESDFEMVDVVNVAHVGNGDGDNVFVIQMGISRPVDDATYEAVLLEALQGLDALKTGEEKYYWVELLYGNWLVGRLECDTLFYGQVAISNDHCEYSDVDPPSYLGDMIRWPGRPVDITSSP